MAVIEGQIEQLKKLKETLEQNKITRFGSIAEINDFIKNYEAEKNQIPKANKSISYHVLRTNDSHVP